MTYYRYSADSPIDEIHVITNVAGGSRAYLHARADITAEQLAPLHALFAEHNWKGVPHNDTKPGLELRGYKHVDELIALLSSQGFLKGKPTITQTSEDRVSQNDRLRNATLRATGLMYNVGDAAYLTYATKSFLQKRAIKGNTSAELLNIAAGIGYAAGGTVLTAYGSKDQSQHEIKTATQKLEHFLQKEQVPIHKDSSAHEILKDEHQPLGTRFNRFMRHYPSEILNTVYTGVGVLLAVSAFKLARAPQALGKNGELLAKLAESKETLKSVKGSAESLQKIEHTVADVEKNKKALADEVKVAEDLYNADKKNKVNRKALDALEERAAIENGESDKVFKDSRRAEKKDIGLGVVTMSSALMGLLVKEKKPIEGQPKKTGLGRVVEWVQEKPLRATGIGFSISTLFHAASTWDKFKNGDRHVRDTVAFRGVFVLANIAAEILLAISSKGHGQGVKTDDSVPHSIIASAAELISQQPADKQSALVDHVSGFLASADMLGGKAQDIAKTLRVHLTNMRTNPWARHVQVEKEQPQASISSTPATKITEASLGTPVKEAGTWQARTQQQKNEAQDAAPALA